MADEAELAPPGDHYVRQRWIRGRDVALVQRANAILVEHGAVHGAKVYDRHGKARWHARKLIDLMVALRLHDRWELVQHVERKGDGWAWSIEYVGEHNERRGHG